jgi:nucleotide-binding universal stress UspA family protein
MFARTTGGELIILHVIPPISAQVPLEFLPRGDLDHVEADIRRWAEQRLLRLTVAAEKFGVRATTVILSGDPADEIIRAIGIYRADLLVVGTNARRGVAKLVLGSVAARALTTAPCPVVTVRGA